MNLDRIDPRRACDRFWLFTIAAIALVIVGAIVLTVILRGEMPKGSGELLSAAVTGLLMLVQKVIEAQQARRMTDQLANSRPRSRQQEDLEQAS